MNSKDKTGSRGFVRLQQFDTMGKMIDDTGFQENGVTNASLAVISGLAGNTGSQNAFTYLALGTGSTAFSASQTTLVAEITDTGLARAAATVSRITTNQTNDTLQLTYTWTATGVKVVTEIGVFNAASTGVMGYRKVPTATVTTSNGNTVLATYVIVYS